MEISRKTVLVTGASGFIGKHLCRHLGLSGLKVISAVRHHPDASAGNGTLCLGDLAQPNGWQGAFAGVDCVVHLAARAHRRASVQAKESDLYHRVNVAGTEQLARAAARAGVRHFIFLSSVAVHGSHTSGKPPFAAADACAPSSVYGATKWKAEQALGLVQAEQPALAIDILRCPVVIGEGAPGNLAILDWALDRRLPLPLASIRNRRAFIAIDDLIAFIQLLIAGEGAGRRVFTLASPDAISTPELIREMAAAKRIRPLLLPFPVPLLHAILSALKRGDKADALARDLVIDTSAARRLGWAPQISVREAVHAAYGR